MGFFGWAAVAAVGAAAGWYVTHLLRRFERLDRAFRHASQELEQLQQAFHRFAPREVVEEIIHRGVAARGERRDVTILFADVIGYTALSEHLSPEDVVGILNGYFRAMSQAITAHRGHVAKFMGDGLMAMFGAPEPNPWQTPDAVWAALAMRDALKEYNVQLVRDGKPLLRIGIGIHRGSVVAGVFGSNELMEFTVIGDVVNTAARIETLTRKFGVDILISETVQALLDDRFRLTARPPEAVKGRGQKVVTYSVERADIAPAAS